MKQLFLDIETTGFSRDWNEIIEIAAVLYNSDTKEMIDSFHMYAKPTRGIPANITELTGITNDMVSSCPPEWSVLLDFCNWCDDHEYEELIGHNCKTFDLQFIDTKCAKYGIKWSSKNKSIVDTLVLARQLKKQNLINVENCKQTTIASYFNIDYTAHSALSDVRALIQIYEKMKVCGVPQRSTLGF